ncbi:DUF998 domain-containing protein [Thermococcus sp. MV5]|nr:DUF998 domain-containing protein [Thermococcus sp. MV5]
MAYLSVAIPLFSIVIAIMLSEWFSITNNALSDLGHAIRSPAALVFNFALGLGGALIIYVSALCIYQSSKLFSAVGFLTGFTLILVAIFDEIYGEFHIKVSIAFFLSLAIFLIAYAVYFKSYLSLPALGISIIAWILHLMYDIPRGAAIPELVSIFAVIPFYIDAMKRFQAES